MPSPLVVDIRGQTINSGPARVGTLDGGLFFNQIGPTITPGGFDSGRATSVAPEGLAIRFRGQIYATVFSSGVSQLHLVAYDEGGANDWTTGNNNTAKGGRTKIVTNNVDSSTGALVIVVTESQDYLVHAVVNTSGQTNWSRYDPDDGVNGTWSNFTNTAAAIEGTTVLFVHDGQVFAAHNEWSTNTLSSFDPVTGSFTNYTLPFAVNGSHKVCFFTLYDRLFLHANDDANSAFVGQTAEFALGVWTSAGAAGQTDLGADTGGGANLQAVRISPTKVLLIGTGGSDVAGGLKAWLVQTVGDSPTGALSMTDVTNPVIPAALRPTSAVGDPDSYKVYAYSNTSDISGSVRHFLFFHPDGDGSVTPTTLFEITDESTELIDLGSPASDSDFAFPIGFYGGGERDGGIDGSTRFVSVSPRGWASDTTGVRVLCSAHGDATVLAYHNLAGGPFTVGETITGGTSGATAVLMGDGAAEGLYVRDVVGTFLPDETVTGGTSGATADLNTVLNHGAVTGGPFQVGETVTGGTSGATGTVTHLGLGGAGETLVKVELTAGTFQNGEVITGGTSGATATLSAGPLGSHGGAADKTIRARFFFSASGPTGKGIPITGYCTMVAGSGVKGTVSKGSGPGGSDELINVIADGGVGGDTPASFEWDFLADGVPKFLVSTLALEIDRV